MLLHHMVHAWFLRVCGVQNKGGADGRMKHGPEFWKVLYVIASLAEEMDEARFSERDGRPAFAEVLLKIHQRDDSKGLHVPMRLQLDMDRDLYGRTVCHTGVWNVPSREDVEKWYKKVSAAAKDAGGGEVHSFDPDDYSIKATPRSEKGSPSSYVEVIWQDRNFDYKRKTIEKHFASLAERFVGGKRVWPLPRGVSTRTYAILNSFLTSGADYAPELTPLPEPGIPLVGKPLRGASANDELWVDVRAYKLGEALSFPELSSHAITRLNTDRTVHTNPLDVLKEIYDIEPLSLATPTRSEKLAIAPTRATAPLPADELRAWARAFMMATHPGKRDGGYYGSNLGIIDRHYGAGVEGLVKAMQSRELEQDWSLALSALWKVS